MKQKSTICLIKMPKYYSRMVIVLKKNNIKRKILIGIVVLISCVWAFYNYLMPSPEEAFASFLTSQELAEDQLIDPLILAGEKVVPVVLKHITDPNMPRRRYAIYFLGNGSYSEAIPYLKAILENPEEEDIIRGDALKAIADIQPDIGEAFSKEYLNYNNHIGAVAKNINTPSGSSKKRT